MCGNIPYYNTVMFFKKKKKIETRSFLKDLEKKLTEMLHCTGCVPYFMETGGTTRKSIFKFEVDEYLIDLEGQQSSLFSEGYFSLGVWFSSGERYFIRTHSLSKDHCSTVFWGWDEKGIARFRETDISGCELYEDSVKTAAENVIKSHMNDMITAIEDVIKNYKEYRSNKEATFKKQLNTIGIDCEVSNEEEEN